MNFIDFFQTATGRPPYGFQVAFATATSFPDLLEAPTGSGKTATAVLGWLWRRLHGSEGQRTEAGRRLVFCLPMRTLVEQTERAALAWRDRLGLQDALGVHVLLGGRVDDAWDEHPEHDAILIGTQDQLLSRALMRGYAMSRYRWPVHFALLNNDCTWVMDEVQLMGVGASTAAQLQAFRERLATAGSVRTVWMTATLAEDRLRTVDVARAFVRQPFHANEPPLLQRLQARKTLTRANASIAKKGSLTALAKEVAAAHEPGTRTLVIVNRVARAQDLRALLASARRATGDGAVRQPIGDVRRVSRRSAASCSVRRTACTRARRRRRPCRRRRSSASARSRRRLQRTGSCSEEARRTSSTRMPPRSRFRRCCP